MEAKQKYQQRQQQLISRFQKALTQLNAAKSINTAYLDIRNILKKVCFKNIIR
jgi:virulence-associated protein VapD